MPRPSARLALIPVLCLLAGAAAAQTAGEYPDNERFRWQPGQDAGAAWRGRTGHGATGPDAGAPGTGLLLLPATGEESGTAPGTAAPAPAGGSPILHQGSGRQAGGVGVSPGSNDLTAPRTAQTVPRATAAKARARRLIGKGRPLSANLPEAADVLHNLQIYFLGEDPAPLHCNGEPVRVTAVALDGLHPFEGVSVPFTGVPAPGRTAPGTVVRYHRAIAYYRATVEAADQGLCGGMPEVNAELLLVRFVDERGGDSWFAPAWRLGLVGR